VTDELELRTATDDELPALAEMISGAFLQDPDDDLLDLERLVYEPDRMHVILDSGRFVASGGVLTRELTVPGAVVPAAHVTAVAVAPTHRRRGLLSRLMSAQLESVRDRGVEPIAALWASEGAIYGRFGYGAAAWHVSYEAVKQETSVPGTTAPGRLRPVVPREATAEFAEIYDRVRVDRPGYSGRPGRWWEHLMADPKERRRGMTALRGILYEVGGTVEGYAIWRAKGGWGDTGPNGEVQVGELVALSTESYSALWRFLFSIDLTRTVKYQFAAVDEPLRYLVTNPTGLGASVSPSLWVRVVDVQAALAARRYAAPVDVVVEVSDAMFSSNEGRWHLVGDGSSAKCEATNAAPDLAFDVRELGAAYLGGVSLRTLADAGLVSEQQQGSLAAASLAFGWHRSPSAVEIF
jgi:predicted acetyltransferase